MIRKYVALALLVASPALLAKGYSPAVTARAGGYDVKFTPSGAVTAVPATGGAAARAEAAFKFQWPNGVDAAGAAISIFTGAKTAGAFGAASAAVGVAAMFAIPAIKTWMETAALVPMNGGGLGTKPAGADSFDYSSDGEYTWQSTAMGSCQALADRSNNPSSGPWVKRIPTSHIPDVSGPGGTCKGNTIYQNYPSTEYDQYNVTLGGTSRRAKQIPVEPVAISMPDAVARLGQVSPSAEVVQALVDLNFPPEPEPAVLTGPPAVFKGNTVQLGLDGTVTEIEERYIASFSPGMIGIGVEKKQTVTTPQKVATTVTTNPDGSQSTAVTTTPKTSSTISTTGAPEVAAITCGLPGTPACKLDEAGTALPITDADYIKRLDQMDTDSATRLPKIGGVADKSFFNGWSSLFAVPALVACEPMPLPRNMGAINPCPVVDGVREVMAYMWALAALFLCLGMVREVI